MQKISLKKTVLSSIVAWALPMLAMAATFDSVLVQIKGWLTSIIGLLFILVTLYFIWGIIKYVMANGDEKKLTDGKQHMLWGIIGMAVMAAAWGIVKVIIDTFGVGGGTIPTTPGVGI